MDDGVATKEMACRWIRQGCIIPLVESCALDVWTTCVVRVCGQGASADRKLVSALHPAQHSMHNTYPYMHNTYMQHVQHVLSSSSSAQTSRLAGGRGAGAVVGLRPLLLVHGHDVEHVEQLDRCVCGILVTRRGPAPTKDHRAFNTERSNSSTEITRLSVRMGFAGLLT